MCWRTCFRFFKNIFIYLAALGLRCSTWDLCYGTWVSLVVVHRLSCPKACGILGFQPGVKPASPALEGGFLITELPGKFPWRACFRVSLLFSFLSPPILGRSGSIAGVARIRTSFPGPCALSRLKYSVCSPSILVDPSLVRNQKTPKPPSDFLKISLHWVLVEAYGI